VSGFAARDAFGVDRGEELEVRSLDDGRLLRTVHVPGAHSWYVAPAGERAVVRTDEGLWIVSTAGDGRSRRVLPKEKLKGLLFTSISLDGDELALVFEDGTEIGRVEVWELPP
jgi:hypothetical protein